VTQQRAVGTVRPPNERLKLTKPPRLTTRARPALQRAPGVSQLIGGVLGARSSPWTSRSFRLPSLPFEVEVIAVLE
jgi:hypothetical protein